jgi:hypothetical protein
MAKRRIQTRQHATDVDRILNAFRRKDQEAVMARAREYFNSLNELANGAKLNTLRIHMGRYGFGEFMGATLPKLGISRTTGYRWARVAASLPQHFRNPVVRAQLMQAGTGKGILTPDGRGNVRLTPAVRAALKQLPPEPREKDGSKARQWIELLLASAGKVRARARLRNTAR